MSFRMNHFIIATMSSQPTTGKKRKRKGPMIIGEIDSAQVVTSKTIYETMEDGTVLEKEVWKSLDETTSDIPAIDGKQNETTGNEIPPNDYYDPVDIPSPPQEPSNTYQVSQQFRNTFVYLNTSLDTTQLFAAICGPCGGIHGSNDFTRGNAGRSRTMPPL